MSRSKIVQYYVEGDMERNLINTLKTEMQCILPGKVSVINVIQEDLKSGRRLMLLPPKTTVVLIFDTDVTDCNIDILRENINILNRNPHVKEVICIPQYKKLEDEIIRSTDIRNFKEFTQSKSNSDCKRDFLKMDLKRLSKKLQEHQFDLNKLWNQKPMSPYSFIENGAHKIKIQ